MYIFIRYGTRGPSGVHDLHVQVLYLFSYDSIHSQDIRNVIKLTLHFIVEHVISSSKIEY